MGNPDSHQTWPPYDTTKDCSHGFCSFHCPKWCYVIFPPPPPIMGDDEEGTAAFSPVVITVIGVLATAFLLIGYYTILSKYCATFDSLFSRRSHRRPAIEPDDEPGGSSRHEVATTWHVSPSNGLDEALISKITVYRYKRGEGVIDGTDCSVCLGEFRDDETLRLLPKCTHAFHLQCIDTWLKSHSNCPLCRANIASTETLVMLQVPAPPPDPENDGRGESSGELAVSMEGTESVLEGSDSGYETIDIRDDDDDEDDNANDDVDGGNVRLIRRSFSMDSCRRGRVSIADVLQMSMEDELSVAKDYGLLVEGGAGSSRGCGGERSSKGSSRGRSLHCVLSPVPMKRSVSSGRFCFARNGRGRNAILPI